MSVSNCLKGTMLALMALVVAACNQSGERSARIESVPATRASIEIGIEEIGLVESTRVANILAPFSGRLVTIVDDGTMVEKDQVVAVLDTESLVEQFDSEIENLKTIKKELENTIETLTMEMRSNLLDVSSASTELDLARVQLASVNQNLSELEYLHSANIIDLDSVRGAESQLLRTEISTFSEDMNLRSMVTGSRSRQVSTEIQLERIELRGQKSLSRIEERHSQILRAEIRAPIDGLFSRHKRWNWQMRRRTERQAGESVSEGEQLGSIPDLSALVVRSQVPESEMGRVGQGTAVRLTFEALGNWQTEGRIRSIAPIAIERETSAGGQVMATGEELTGEKVFEVEIEILGTDRRLRPELTARAQIVLDRREDVLTVPLMAVNTVDGKHFVEVVDNRGRLETRPVTLGLSDRQKVEVVQGLEDDEMVVISGGDAGGSERASAARNRGRTGT